MERLSPREKEVLEHLAQGLTERQIGERLFISPNTVKTHLRIVLIKLEARNRIHAVAKALRAGIID